ncbi:MAG: tetratricopeptide repeat protein [Pseudomonadales bacterium]
MLTLRNTIAAVAAALLLTSALQSHAQSPEELKTMQTFLSIMDSYFQIIESTHAVASDNEKAAIVQMQKIQEVYEELGKKAQAADILRGVLQDSRNSTIRNAAYMLLADNLKDTGRADEALKLLQQGLAENIAAATK